METAQAACCFLSSIRYSLFAIRNSPQRRNPMRIVVSAALAAVVLVAAVPAQAAWKSYINRELGFSFRAPGEVASILGEREYMFQEGKKVLVDTFGRVEPGKDAVYGRKIVVDLPDHKGRTTAAFYFTKGRLISLEATVLPQNGDFGSPDPALFVDSIAFELSRTDPNAIALATPSL